MDCRTQLAELANDELDKGDFLMATKILTTGIRLDPENHELYFERSICHHKLGDFQASLNDANEAIRINSEDYNLHYQKGLALLGLSLFEEAKSSFKKAIELRAKQEDSRLWDIFELLKNAIYEWNAKRRPGRDSSQVCGETPPIARSQTNTSASHQAPCNQQASTSTVNKTETQQPKAPASNDHSVASINPVVKVNGDNLVDTDRDNIHAAKINQNNKHNGLPTCSNPIVSMSSTHIPCVVTPKLDTNIVQQPQPNNDFLSSHPIPNQLNVEQREQQFDWNIRRSERIFLHGSNGSVGSSGPQLNTLPRGNDVPGVNQSHGINGGSILSSASSSKGMNKRIHEIVDSLTYQPNKRPKDNMSLNTESDVDVDDSFASPKSIMIPTGVNESPTKSKRVLVAPSSSMPATTQGPSTSASINEGSYSTKYKRLRRDRERARRGTSKLCSIKLEDLEEMRLNSSKRSMRVIAPVDGWLYSGLLTVDVDDNQSGPPDYVVQLDGDTSRSSYLFTQETVLSDVIKEVRVNSVSELRKGARICCYWSRQYKCLSTGVVTSRTFEATKSLVSVKYDNGDLSALPLEDLRLLPPDYPKYMSNCDPLLLSRAAENNISDMPTPITITERVAKPITASNHIGLPCRNVEEPTSIVTTTTPATTVTVTNDDDQASASDVKSETTSQGTRTTILGIRDDEEQPKMTLEHRVCTEVDFVEEETDDEDATIPPTAETIDFITSESTLKEQSGNLHRMSMTQDQALPKETQSNTSRASSEENNFSYEYWPWVFEGPSKKKKRHGRPYREQYLAIRRRNEIIRVGDSAELMPRDKKTLPFIAKIDSFWATSKGEMKVRVRWYYRLSETRGEPKELEDGTNALFETDHFDENDVQSIHRSARILSWSEYSRNYLGHVNKTNTNASPSVFYVAGYYNPVRQIKNLRSDVKESQPL